MKKLAFSVFAAALTFGANAAEHVKADVNAFDGIYFGLGVAAVDNGVKYENTNANANKYSDHSTRLAATVALGYGKAIGGKAFLGLEAGLDASQNFEYATGRAKVNGLTPSAALRLGYASSSAKRVVYLKAGAAYSKAKSNIDSEIKCDKWAPIVALGAEKICGKLRTRLEAEYRFRSSKSVDPIKLTNRGAVTLRAMAVYTVKM